MSSQLNFHVIKEIFERFKEADPEPKGELIIQMCLPYWLRLH